MAFDGIVTKAIATELQGLSGARIDKILHPIRNSVMLGFYTNRTNHLLNICIDSSNYRMTLTKYPKPNPKVATNFCMILRKHLLGLFLKNVITTNLERIITLEFEGLNDIDDVISKKLVIELMGKHCNIILLDDNSIIIDSLRHILGDENTRSILPHHKYITPKSDKLYILDFSIDENIEKIQNNFTNTLSETICTIYTGLSKSFVDSIVSDLNIYINDNSSQSIQKLLTKIIELISKTDGSSLAIRPVYINDFPKDFILCDNSLNKEFESNQFLINYALDELYNKKENSETFRNKKNNLTKTISDIHKKILKKLKNMDEKLKSCENMDQYMLYGELLTANLYSIKNISYNLSEITVFNYYTNSDIIIPLDKKYSPTFNTKLYYKKYNKLKNTLEIVTKQKIEAHEELKYIESIMFALEGSHTIEDITDISDEITENITIKEKINIQNNAKNLSKKQNNKQNKNVKSNTVKKSTSSTKNSLNFNPIKYVIDNYTLLVGRNNKENDYLTLKYAQKSDIWFHTKDIHGSHCILSLADKNTIPSDEILLKCAEIAAKHSKAKDSSNVPIDYCEVKFVKKPNNSKPGMVIYTNNKTLYVL